MESFVVKDVAKSLLALLLICSSDSWAYSCSPEALADAGLVFVGKVVSKRERVLLLGKSIYYTFAISSVEFGSESGTVEVQVSSLNGGPMLLVGEVYRVYAKKLPEYGTNWRTGQCFGKESVLNAPDWYDHSRAFIPVVNQKSKPWLGPWALDYKCIP
jgi:hypothetical protein